MILLIGGTSDTAPMANLLAEAGYEVIISQATNNPLAMEEHPRIRLRRGPLDAAGLEALVEKEKIRAIVNAAHPYARNIRETARTVANRLGILHLDFVRPPEIHKANGVIFAPDHEQAARIAFSFKRPVLLTTGSRNLEPYAKAAEITGMPLAVRVLNDPQSLAACLSAGIDPDYIISGRGPFCLQENLDAIDRFSIGVLVTKDGGKPSGVGAKLDAARLRNCKVVAVSRPVDADKPKFHTHRDLIEALTAKLPPTQNVRFRPETNRIPSSG